MSNLPFSSIRVLDLGRVLAAPFASQMLGDLGAEVIKVERPRTGDDARLYGPPFLQNVEGGNTRESSFYLSVNRNKKSITVDITKLQGQELIRQLVRHCDVLIENYKVGDLERYGLDYASIKEINPSVVYCSLTGFGQTGPYRARPGYDNIFQAMSGLMSVTGNAPDTPGGGPMKTGPSIADAIAGQVAFGAIAAALYHRDANNGSGQHVDVSLLDSLIAANTTYSSHYLVSGEVPGRRGTDGNNVMPSRLFSCADGDFVMSAGNEAQYQRFCEVLGRPDLKDDQRFASNSARVVNRRALAEVFEPLVALWNLTPLLDALDKAGVPAAPVYDMKQVFADPHVQSRSMAVEVDHPISATGKVSLVGHPVKYSATPVSQYVAPPTLGEHTEEVLRNLLSLDTVEIQALRDSGIL